MEQKHVHLIDLDATPYIPDGWSVRPEDQLASRVTGTLIWDPAAIGLYLSKRQKGGRVIKGDTLRKELAKQPVLNGNVLDHLLAHQDLIPDLWKGKYIFFWGTIYRDWDDDLFASYLYRGGGQWRRYHALLDDFCDGSDPAAILIG